MRKPKLNSIAVVFTLATLGVLTVLPVPASVDDQCRSDQRQMQNGGAMMFGAKTVLGQTFVPSVPGQRVCRIKIWLTKNAPGAGNVTLRLVRSNFAPLDAAVTIPGGAIPMGNSVQLFEFGCNGAPLAGMPFYGIRLESPASQIGAYSWQGVGNNPYVKPGNGGRGWRNLNGGEGQWISLGGWDYAFDIYMCP